MNSSTDRRHGFCVTDRFVYWCFRPRRHSGPCLVAAPARYGGWNVWTVRGSDTEPITFEEACVLWRDIHSVLG